MKNKLFTSFLMIAFFCFSIKNAYAEEKYDYVHILAGECAETNGFLFSEDGMARLYVNVEEKIRLACAEKDRDIKTCKLTLDSCERLRESQLRIQKEMFEGQLLVKQQVIDSYRNQAYWENVKIIGGIVVGLGVGLLVGKLFLK